MSIKNIFNSSDTTLKYFMYWNYAKILIDISGIILYKCVQIKEGCSGWVGCA